MANYSWDYFHNTAAHTLVQISSANKHVVCGKCSPSLCACNINVAQIYLKGSWEEIVLIEIQLSTGLFETIIRLFIGKFRGHGM